MYWRLEYYDFIFNRCRAESLYNAAKNFEKIKNALNQEFLRLGPKNLTSINYCIEHSRSKNIECYIFATLGINGLIMF